MVWLENLPKGARRSRRNLMQIGAMTASAIFAGLMTTPASAKSHKPGKGDGPPGKPMCFLKGTRIRTADGDKKIEDLAVGDLLPGLFGGIRPIQWIGRYSFRRPDPTKAWVTDFLPVRVARSALGLDIPSTDLCITRGHALFIDGLLVPVCNLINGRTVTIYDAGDVDHLEYFHLKLPTHDVIHAEDTPCETLVYLDENAVNFAEYLRQGGPPETEEARCAPWAGFGRRVEMKSRFRSAISPWVDRREKLDVIRDQLEEGAIVLTRDLERV